MIVLEAVLVGFLVVTAVLVALLPDPIEATAVFAAFSLALAIVWILLAAPDVAVTEAAVGAGVMVILLLITVMQTEWEPSAGTGRRLASFAPLDWRAFFVTVAVAIPLSYSVGSFPDVGDPAAPAVERTLPTGEPSPYYHYVGETAEALDLPNAVVLVLAVFRNLDTLGEVAVAFTAVLGVLIVLDRTRITTSRNTDDTEGLAFPDPYVMSPVGMTAVRLVVPLVFVFGVYLTLYGALVPGGGFQGGVVMGASVVLMALVFGHRPTSNWVDERILVGILVGGVGLFVAVGLGSFFFGGTLLEVLAYPVDVATVVEILEVSIGLLVGGVVAALVLAVALGHSEANRNTSDHGGDRL